MAQQTNMTAVEWLIDKIAEKSIMEKDRYYISYNSGTIDITDLIEQAKQMENNQEQETKAYWFGRGVLAGRENRIEELQPKKHGK